MEAEENPEIPPSGMAEATGGAERRQQTRFEVDEDASLLLVSHDSWHPCRVVDLSLNGCQVSTGEVFRAGTQKQVEVRFKINGIAFRLSGTTQWTDGRHAVGIRFSYPTSRRRDELAEVLGEVEAAQAAEARRRAAEEAAAEAEASLQVVVPPATFPVPEPDNSAQRSVSSQPTRHERRVYSRHEFDTSAVIHLVKIGSALKGCIQDLSVGGCRIRTEEIFPVGIYTRVETEFRLEGLPFRLGGVIQAIPDARLVGIRFLDLSDRKREQVEQLIEEIDERNR